MNPEIQKIQDQIDRLNEMIKSLNNSSAFPRDVEKAIRTRIADVKENPGSVAVTAIPGNAAFNLPNTTGTLPIIVKGKTYNILYQ